MTRSVVLGGLPAVETPTSRRLRSSATGASSIKPESYTQPFLSFISKNPTVYHAISHFSHQLSSNGFTALSERDSWTSKLKRGGKYYLERNGSGLIAFTIGKSYQSGNGAAIIAAHIDALTARVKPISTKPMKEGFQQLGVAQYGGALNQTWIDRDLGIGGRVLVKNSETGKVETKLVRLDWPIARIPSIAPHFGIAAEGQANRETRMVPIIGLDNGDVEDEEESPETPLGKASSFAATQPPQLVKAIAGEIGVKDYTKILNWELELFDFQPAQLGGLSKELIFAGRIDDKLCSYAGIEALLLSDPSSSGIINLVGLFDDEEIGSLLRQGARSNFLPSTIERINDVFLNDNASVCDELYRTYANSFMVSADVTHAFNPNYSDVYLENHAPRLNIGLAISYDSNGHMTTDASSATILSLLAERSSSKLQTFQIRNDSRSGGTVGPMLSSATGVRAIDAGIPQLSMHSIRATTGSLDPGLGVKCFAGVLQGWEEVRGLMD